MIASIASARKLASFTFIALLLSLTALGCGSDPTGCQQNGCPAGPSTCDGNQLVARDQGTCVDNACVYSVHPVVCPHGCRDGACVDPCADVSCTTAPPAVCDGSNLRLFTLPGGCADGACTFASSVMPCPFGCDGGHCKGDPCSGVTCMTPPTNTCDDPTHLRVYEHAGTCGDGTCSYAPSVMACAFGCDNGACKADPCLGVTCMTPPANSCDDPTHLRVYDHAGTCDHTMCSYAPTVMACAFGCDSGACKADPCLGVTCTMPPAAHCDGTSATLISYAATGTCSAGACSYTPSNTTCALGCANGKCNTDPCAGVTCTTPPANHCDGASTLVSYAATGTCSAAACNYTPTNTTCALGCANGKCKTDLCEGVTCTTPPADHCETSTQLRTSSAPGTCSAGVCSYPSTLTTCALGCANDQCTIAMPTCTAQPTLGTCDFSPQGCIELTGAAYTDPGNVMDQCGTAYTPGAFCKRDLFVGGCLLACGTPNEFINFYPKTLFTEPSARADCASHNGLWVP